jgi:thioredoxin-dependent peroxiredoxin
MSKKTQKKSPKTPSRTAAGTSTRKSGPRAPRTAAKTSAGKSARQPPTASHAGASKTLNPRAPKKPAALQPAKKVSEAGKQQAPAPRTALREGVKAPAFTLPTPGARNVSLADYLGRKLVIFFYPRADTPGCTREAIDFTRLSAAFADADTAVLGVSADPLAAQEAFRDKHQLSMALASDEKHDMLEAYGVWAEKSMYGRTFLGILRTTVLVDRNGKIAKLWRNVKVDGHADAVLATAQAL